MNNLHKVSGLVIVVCCLAWILVRVSATEPASAETSAPEEAASSPVAVSSPAATPSPAAASSPAAAFHATAHTPQAGTTFRDCPNCPEMVVIPAGKFNMGSPDNEDERTKDEGPVHPVKVKTFALGTTEVTHGQFAEFVKQTKYDPGDTCRMYENGKFVEHIGRNWHKLDYAQNSKHPVVCINWNDAKAYTKWLSRITGKPYRLPTEAEWEYAARGKTKTSRYWGDNPDVACKYANVADQTAQAQIHGATYWALHNCADGFAFTAPVGRFKANAFGLHDMLGNVWEWTEDSYHDSYRDAPTDGQIWQGDGAKRVLRGGSWNNGPRGTRSAKRGKDTPDIRFSTYGFRLARKLP